MRRTCRGGRSSEDRNSPASQFFSSSYSFFLWLCCLTYISFPVHCCPAPLLFPGNPPRLLWIVWDAAELQWVVAATAVVTTTNSPLLLLRRGATAATTQHTHTHAQHKVIKNHKKTRKHVCCDHNCTQHAQHQPSAINYYASTLKTLMRIKDGEFCWW